MKIKHTTYSQCRGGRLTQPRSSQEMKGFSTSRITHTSNQETLLGLSVDDERAVTMWPRADITHSDNLPDMTAYLVQEQHLEKTIRKKEKSPSTSHKSGRTLPKTYSHSNTTVGKTVSQPSEATHSLRRKPKLSESLRGCLGSPKSAENEKHREAGQDKMIKVHRLRDAIRAGKMERVIPPAQAPRSEGPLASPHSTRNPFPNLISHRTFSSKKPSSRPSKLAEIITNSADILDETRRELSGKFLPPFEHLNYPSFCAPGRKSKPCGGSDTSSESFFCVGDDEHTKESQALKKRQQDNSGRRLSGDGTSPWTHGAPAACRLCSKPGVRGIRGLCEECERDFIRPKTRNFEFLDQSDEEHDEIKPTPPLKDVNYLPIKKVEAKSKSVFTYTLETNEGREMKTRVEAGRKMTGAGRPKIVSQTWTLRKSQDASLQGQDEDDEKFRNWQTPVMRAEYERTHGMFKRWSDCYNSDEPNKYEEEDDMAPLVERDGKRKGDPTSRTSNFYRFYDDLLREHGAKTPLHR